MTELCKMCDGTGLKDYAGMCMEPCDHGIVRIEDEVVRIEAVRDHLVFEGVEYHKTDGLGEICRLLSERNDSTTTEVVIMRGETPCMVLPYRERAKRILKESSRDGFTWDKFREKTDA